MILFVCLFVMGKNEEMVSAQVNDLIEKIKNLEEKNGRLEEQLISYRKQQSIAASALTIGSCNGEPDITRLSVQEDVVERYQQLKNDYDSLKKSMIT